ncbi:protein of unknown function (DUF222) [Parafrankia irregularis]|uniref:DUF222 domain-containing protein n=1 Tax=Parafrankia irregularis TaxID=795642 RepID=A0A0S4QHF0_9ACTN|nr:DUF222 domain-containing protein [Parafrankia sp. CH37]CUU54670.1 protein of unknown function (DUF222) [Parafrankia irregularis]
MPAPTRSVEASDASRVRDAAAAFDDQVRDLLYRIGVRAAALAAAHAGMLRLLAEFAGLRPSTEADPLFSFDMFAPEELAGVLRVSATTAGGQMGFAFSAVRRLPRAMQALEGGVLDLQRLRSLETAVSPLTDEQTSQVEEQVLAGGPRRNRGAFGAACRRAVLNVDPGGAAERAAERRKGRHVRLYPGDDATSTLSALLPAEDAAACDNQLNQIADEIIRTRDADDQRTRDQIRADTLVDRITGRTPLRPLPCDVQVIVPITALLGLGEEPGEIPGFGPIPADIARDLAMRPTSTWRRMLVDPLGALIEVADRRHPSPAQVRHVRARNRTCVHPGCTRRATRTDTDHTTPYAAGGPTIVVNLGPLCLKHHRLRHHPDRPWIVRQPRPGTFTWTSPLGTRFTVHPHDYITGEEHLPAG